MAKDGGRRKSADKAADKAADRSRPKKSDRARATASTSRTAAKRTIAPSSPVTGTEEAVVAGAMGAASMGPVSARPALPETREELTQLWLEARRRRHAAPLDSEEYAQAAEDVARIEVQIAAVERALTPPRV